MMMKTLLTTQSIDGVSIYNIEFVVFVVTFSDFQNIRRNGKTFCTFNRDGDGGGA